MQPLGLFVMGEHVPLTPGRERSEGQARGGRTPGSPGPRHARPRTRRTRQPRAPRARRTDGGRRPAATARARGAASPASDRRPGAPGFGLVPARRRLRQLAGHPSPASTRRFAIRMARPAEGERISSRYSPGWTSPRTNVPVSSPDARAARASSCHSIASASGGGPASARRTWPVIRHRSPSSGSGDLGCARPEARTAFAWQWLSRGLPPGSVARMRPRRDARSTSVRARRGGAVHRRRSRRRARSRFQVRRPAGRLRRADERRGPGRGLTAARAGDQMLGDPAGTIPLPRTRSRICSRAGWSLTFGSP